MTYEIDTQTIKDDNNILESTNLTDSTSKPELRRSEDESIYLGSLSSNRRNKSLQRGIKLGTFGLILSHNILYEIIESARISPITGVSDLFKGLINHRSNVAPVYDLSYLLDEQTRNQLRWERRRVLLLNSGLNAVGITLYDLPAQITSNYRIHPEDMHNIPEIFSQHTDNAFLSNNMLWLELNFDTFFSELSTLATEIDQ